MAVAATCALGSPAMAVSIAAAPLTAPAHSEPQTIEAENSPGADLQSYLAAAREALGWNGERAILSTSGTTEKHGMPAAYRWVFSPEGLARWDMRGTFPESVGFDGRGVVVVNGRSPAFSLDLLESERWLTKAFVWSGAWSIENNPFLIEGDPSAEAGTTRLRLRLAKGLLQATLIVDDATHYPKALIFDEAFEGGRLDFADWRKDKTPAFPWKVTETSGFGEVVEIIAQDARPWVGPTPTYRPARIPRRDSKILSDHQSELEVKRVPSGHWFVRAHVDGQDLGWFLFDSGLGASIITKKAADQLELGTFGQTYLMGFGSEAPRPVPFRQAHLVQVGPLLLDGLVMTETESMGRAKSLLGEEVCAGALGWDVFLRAVVEMDGERESIRLFDPELYEAPPSSWHAVRLHWKLPYMTARFEGDREGLFGLDTGAGKLSVLFHHEAASRLRLLEGRKLEPQESRGASGAFSTAKSQLEWFEIAGRRHAPAPILLSLAPDGESDPYALGFVGSGFLGEGRWIFDYQNERVGFADSEPTESTENGE